MSPLRVGDDLAVLGREQLGQLVHVALRPARLNSNITRARRCGLVAAQAGCAALAASTARVELGDAAKRTWACTSPVLGLNTSP